METPLLLTERVESSSCWTQLRVLLWKQRLQAARNLRATAAIVFSPVAVCLILSAFQLMSNSVLDRAVPFPSAARAKPSHCNTTASSNPRP